MAFPTRKPKPEGTQQRVSGLSAGYLELEGAKKDGECVVVEVKNGISKAGGCCNLWSPVKGASNFSCGTCEYVR